MHYYITKDYCICRVRVMVFNATFNNIFFCISVISWRSVLLVKETEYPGENHRLAASHLQSLSRNDLLSTLEFYSNLQL